MKDILKDLFDFCNRIKTGMENGSIMYVVFEGDKIPIVDEVMNYFGIKSGREMNRTEMKELNKHSDMINFLKNVELENIH